MPYACPVLQPTGRKGRLRWLACNPHTRRPHRSDRYLRYSHAGPASPRRHCPNLALATARHAPPPAISSRAGRHLFTSSAAGEIAARDTAAPAPRPLAIVTAPTHRPPTPGRCTPFPRSHSVSHHAHSQSLMQLTSSPACPRVDHAGPRIQSSHTPASRRRTPPHSHACKTGLRSDLTPAVAVASGCLRSPRTSDHACFSTIHTRTFSRPARGRRPLPTAAPLPATGAFCPAHTSAVYGRSAATSLGTAATSDASSWSRGLDVPRPNAAASRASTPLRPDSLRRPPGGVAFR